MMCLPAPQPIFPGSPPFICWSVEAAGATVCTPCAAGTYSTAPTASCATCDAGSYAPEGEVSLGLPVYDWCAPYSSPHPGRLFRLHSLRRRHLHVPPLQRRRRCFNLSGRIVLPMRQRCPDYLRNGLLLPRRRLPADTLPPRNVLPGRYYGADPMSILPEGLLSRQVPYVEAVSQRAVLEVRAVCKRVPADRVRGGFSRDVLAGEERVRRQVGGRSWQSSWAGEARHGVSLSCRKYLGLDSLRLIDNSAEAAAVAVWVTVGE